MNSKKRAQRSYDGGVDVQFVMEVNLNIHLSPVRDLSGVLVGFSKGNTF